MTNSSLIFDIKRYAINDGPGIRITVFFKGCPLSCRWCHNPESQSCAQQRMYSKIKCIACEECVKACPNHALELTVNGIVTDAHLCNLWGKCADVCPTKAIEMTGELMSVDQIMQQIKKESLLMDHSEGGVTFSGGEPLMHPDLLIPLLKACNEERIHTCVDTSGHAKMETLKEVAQYTDLFLYDLKLMDAEKHKEWTGVRNDKILSNIEMLTTIDAELIIRIPLIKGVNDNDDNIRESAQFIAGLEGRQPALNLLPHHNVAEKKYEKLGVQYDRGEMDAPSESRIEKIIGIFESFGIKASIGG